MLNIFLLYIKRNYFKEVFFFWILIVVFFFIIWSFFFVVIIDVFFFEVCLLDFDFFDLGISNDAFGDDLDFEDFFFVVFVLKVFIFVGFTVDLDFSDFEFFDFDVFDNDLDLEFFDFEFVLYVELSLDFLDDCFVFCFYDFGFDEIELDFCIFGLFERDWLDFLEEGFDWLDFGDLSGFDFGVFVCFVFLERFVARFVSLFMGFVVIFFNLFVGFVVKLVRLFKGLVFELLELLLEVEIWKYNEILVKKKVMVFIL